MPLAQQRDRGHHLARRAKTALEGVVINKGLLDRMQYGVLGETLDRRDFASLCGSRKHEAAIHASAIEMHRAGAALTKVTALLGPREMEVFAQKIELGDACIDDHLVWCAIDTQGDCHMRAKFHCHTPQR
jgi:hypothetical protein